jgi:hypothetical protein
VLHFVVLGTLWGLSWLLVALALPGLAKNQGARVVGAISVSTKPGA